MDEAGETDGMKIVRSLVWLMAIHAVTSGPGAAQPSNTPKADSIAARAVNALGLELLSAASEPGANALLSPYSIQMALAMTFAGAAGDTQTEMAKVLHYPADESELHNAFSALQRELEEIAKN